MSKEKVHDIWRGMTQAEKDEFGSFDHFKRWMLGGHDEVPTEVAAPSVTVAEPQPSSQRQPRTHRVPQK